MKPTRAAWLFAAGLAWLVLRGILVNAFPALRAERIAQDGGIWLLIPLLSFVASLAAPVFFISFLRHHSFAGRPVLRSLTLFAVVASVLSCGLVMVSLGATAGVIDLGSGRTGVMDRWLPAVIPFLFVVSIFLFLFALARSSDLDPGLRSAARVGAISTSIPILMILAWIGSSLFGVPAWYPAFSQGLVAKLLSLSAAAALFWFLESFARRYDRDGDVG